MTPAGTKSIQPKLRVRVIALFQVAEAVSFELSDQLQDSDLS